MSMDRDEGFYWIRVPSIEGLPVIAQWLSGVWLFAGTDQTLEDRLVTVLGERLKFSD